jgi:beta-mannosidase
MKRISLDGAWELQGSAYGEMAEAAGEWIPATVPGDVHVDLMAAGRLDEMYFSDNIAQNKWVTEKAWWMRRGFTVAETDLEPFTELVFKGIDTVADIYLNGEKIGHTENMFREYRFDVSGRIRTREPNELAVCIQPVCIVMKQHDAKPYFACFNDHRIFVRKAQCHFGWDWAPDCPGAGIWDSVLLESYDHICLDGLNIHAACDGAVSFFVSLDGAVQEMGTDGLELHLTVNAPDGARLAEERWPATGIKNFRNLFIENPQLWWPNGMGDQPLYTYEIELLNNGTACDRKAGRFGIREVRLEEKPLGPDKMGFAFIVNGEHCFCKGANWVPLDSFTGAIPPEKYNHMLTLAKEAHFNMLRVWGGGIYEKDIFYDLCDELGLMVWQDFMFACGDVPDDHDWFVDEVRREVDYQVRRLRTHTSIVYWVGGNEKSGDFFRKMVNHGDSLFDETIPGIVQTLDPFRPYRRGSPYAYVDSGNHPKSGDAHLSALGETFAPGSKGFNDYRNCVNHIDTSFNSEFAIQGPARRQSFEKFMPADHWWPMDDLWDYRIVRNPYDHHDTRTFAQRQLALCRNFFGEPRDHAEFIKFGMTVHAEAMRDEMFGYRTKRPVNSGSLFWMFSDSWPTGSWAVVDWYGLPKAAYYAAKRAARPLQVGWKVRPDENGWQLFACNDALRAFSGTLRFGEETVAGARKWTRVLDVSIPANASTLLAEIAAKEFSGSADSFLFAELDCGNEKRGDVFFPNFWKDIPWPEPGLRVDGFKILSENKGAGTACFQALERYEVDVSLTTERFARCVHLEGINEGCADGAPVYVSDEFFDLRAGETRTIRLKSAAPVRTENIKAVHWLEEWS